MKTIVVLGLMGAQQPRLRLRCKHLPVRFVFLDIDDRRPTAPKADYCLLAVRFINHTIYAWAKQHYGDRVILGLGSVSRLGHKVEEVIGGVCCGS